MSVKKNYIYNMVYQVLAIVVTLITTPYLARVLGAESIGIYSFTVSVATYFMIFGTLGIGIYGAREIAYVQHDKKKRSKVFWEISILKFITTSISLLLFFATFVMFSEYRVYFLILSLYLIGNMIDVSWLFQGVEDMKAMAIRSSVIRLLSAAATFLFIKSPDDLWIYVLLYALTAFLSTGVLWFKVPAYVERVKLKTLEIKKHLKPTLGLFLPQIASQIYVVLDKVMIGAIIVDKSELGYYEQGEKIVKMLITVITAVAAAMSPRIAHTFITGNKKDLREYMMKTFRFTFMLAFPMISGLIVIAPRFVPFFFGPGYDKVAIIMQLLSSIIMTIGFGSAIGVQYLIQVKRQKELTISYIAGAAINFALNAILINLLGAVGACIGTILAELTVTSLQLYFVRKEFKVKDLVKVSNKYFLAATLMLGLCLLLNLILDGSTVSLFIIMVSGVFFYTALLLSMREPLLLSTFANFYGKFKKVGRK